ncbi:MAG: energy transducer TonB [Magnetococcus sp. DMHC-6]
MVRVFAINFFEKRLVGKVWWAVGFSLLLHVLVIHLLFAHTLSASVLPKSPFHFIMATLPPPSHSDSSMPEVLKPQAVEPSPEKEFVVPVPKPLAPVRKPIQEIKKVVAPLASLPSSPPASSSASSSASSPTLQEEVKEVVASASGASGTDPKERLPQMDMDRPPDVRAAYLSNPKPIYPLSARRKGVEGTVVLTVDVTGSGEVLRVEIKDSSGYAALDQAAVTTVSQWRFIPAQRKGKPSAATVLVPIRFQLQSKS